jgi:hypothetical protein
MPAAWVHPRPLQGLEAGGERTPHFRLFTSRTGNNVTLRGLNFKEWYLLEWFCGGRCVKAVLWRRFCHSRCESQGWLAADRGRGVARGFFCFCLYFCFF